MPPKKRNPSTLQKAKETAKANVMRNQIRKAIKIKSQPSSPSSPSKSSRKPKTTVSEDRKTTSKAVSKTSDVSKTSSASSKKSLKVTPTVSKSRKSDAKSKTVKFVIPKDSVLHGEKVIENLKSLSIPELRSLYVDKNIKDKILDKKPLKTKEDYIYSLLQYGLTVEEQKDVYHYQLSKLEKKFGINFEKDLQKVTMDTLLNSALFTIFAKIDAKNLTKIYNLLLDDDEQSSSRLKSSDVTAIDVYNLFLSRVRRICASKKDDLGDLISDDIHFTLNILEKDGKSNHVDKDKIKKLRSKKGICEFITKELSDIQKLQLIAASAKYKSSTLYSYFSMAGSGLMNLIIKPILKLLKGMGIYMYDHKVGTTLISTVIVSASMCGAFPESCVLYLNNIIQYSSGVLSNTIMSLFNYIQNFFSSLTNYKSFNEMYQVVMDLCGATINTLFGNNYISSALVSMFSLIGYAHQAIQI